MSWMVEFTNDFEDWWHGLTERQQDSLSASVELLI